MRARGLRAYILNQPLGGLQVVVEKKGSRKYVARLGTLEATGRTATEARQKLEEELERLTRNHLTRRYLFTKSGEVLCVTYYGYSWGYDIARVGGAHVCSCLGVASYEEALEKARSHAEQSYGGVVWEVL